jgi:DNA-binding transcriptional MerR regulator
MEKLSPSTSISSHAARRLLRMRDLTAGAQLSRQAIHFYIAEGLLPPAVSSGRNMAVYSEEHLQRLHWIQKLQREHFLSLNAIKGVLNGEDIEAFSPEQKQVLRRVRDELPEWARSKGRGEVLVADLVGTHVSEGEFVELAKVGIITVHGSGAGRKISQADSEIVDCFVSYKQAGATRDRGYQPADLVTMDHAVDGLVRQLAQLYTARWQNAPVKDAVAFLEAVVPISERFMAILLRKKLRELITILADSAEVLADE